MIKYTQRRLRFNFLTLLFSLLFSIASTAQTTQGTPREAAWKIHNRLVGVPPSPAVLQQMEQLITANQMAAAAQLAMENPFFYSVTLKNWIKKWTNIDQSNRVEFNDYTATVLGMIRDDIPFDTVLYGDHLYVVTPDGTLPAYSNENNNHYREAEARKLDLKTALVYRAQSQMNNIEDTAGVLTTRASGEAFFSAGTNRRVTRFTFMNFLCRDFEALHDSNVPDIYVRRDVERDPGGDSRTYRNNCVGCHAGQDALGGAWAYFDYVGNRLIHNPDRVVPKMNLNNLFEDGHVVEDDSWVNLWHLGVNSNLGFRGQQEGNGARTLGFMLARSQAFGQCMAKRVYEWVCLRSDEEAADKVVLAELAALFEANNQYNMKNLIAQTSARCFGGSR